jgi:hypothetical protein
MVHTALDVLFLSKILAASSQQKADSEAATKVKIGEMHFMICRFGVLPRTEDQMQAG